MLAIKQRKVIPTLWKNASDKKHVKICPFKSDRFLVPKYALIPEFVLCDLSYFIMGITKEWRMGTDKKLDSAMWNGKIQV